jgi:hypothetical protein
MSGTITAQLSVAIINGEFADNWTVSPIELTQTAIGGGNPGCVDLTTSELDIAFGLTDPGWVLLINLSDTNTIEYGPKSGGVIINFLALPPLAFTWLYLKAGVTLRAKTAASTAKLWARALER